MPNTRVFWLHALSPTHAGIGRGVGYIDLPIDRDGTTGWPIIRGSGFKGVWADHYRATKAAREQDPYLKAAFGTAGDDNNSNAGALIPTDARLVCLPVRSFCGTFAWVTSPLCLQMLRRTLRLAGLSTDVPDVFANVPATDAHHFEDGAQTTALKEGEHIYLEDLDFKAKACPIATRWARKIAAWVFQEGESAWQEQFIKRFVVLPDTAFDFLCETGTEVHTRVRISDDSKTVVDGALWTEESLPAETIMAGIVQCDRVFQKKESTPRIAESDLIAKFASDSLSLQVGGNASIGRGRMRCVFTPVTGGIQ